jgi:Tfp pilus assembly protein FimV
MSTLAARPASQAATRGSRRGGDHTSTSRNTAVLETIGLILVAILLVIGLWLAGGGNANPATHALIRVDEGQTLWSIAAQHPMPGLTTEQTAELIAKTNQLSGDSIAAGSELAIPVPEAVGDDLTVAMR